MVLSYNSDKEKQKLDCMAKDVFHKAVKTALQKDGWTITHDPYPLAVGGVEMYVERSQLRLLIYNPEQEVIVLWR